MPMYSSRLVNESAKKLNTFGLLREDPDLFADFQLPSGLNKQLCIDTILQKHGAAPLQHPDPHWMRYMLGAFARRNFIPWQRLYKTMLIEYNPLWNHESFETETNATQRNTNETGTLDSTVDGKLNSNETGNTTARHTEKENSKTQNTADTSETRTTDATGQTLEDFTQNVNSESHSQTDTTLHTDTTNNQDTTSNTTTDTRRHEEVTEETQSETIHDISPENAPDYQPDDTTHGTETKNTVSDGTEDVDSRTTSHTTDIGTVDTDTTSTTDATSNQDTASHRQVDTKSHEDMAGMLHSTSQTDYGQQAGSEDETGRVTDYGQTSQTVTDQDTTSHETMAEQYTHEFRTWGANGNKTPQEMLQQERELVQFNMYSLIADYYHHEFCLKFY